jgi:mannose-6-phosphate isomerase-like protein (cupin superfamily)
MYVVPNPQPAEAGIPGIVHTTLAGSSDGLRDISVWHQSMVPGAATPPHRHDCEEVILCTAGNGELHIDGRVEHFGPNTTLFIPRNADHQIFSIGDEPLQTIAIFGMTPVEVYLPDGQRLDLPWRS